MLEKQKSEVKVSSTFQEPEPEPALCHQSMCLGGAEARGNLFIVSYVGMLRVGTHHGTTLTHKKFNCHHFVKKPLSASLFVTWRREAAREFHKAESRTASSTSSH